MTATCSVEGCRKPTYCRSLCCGCYKRALKARPPGTARPRPPAAESNPATPARMSLTEFLAALAAAAPHLPGASCRSHIELFDRATGDTRTADTRQARTAALNLCHGCPAIHACRAWLDTLPADHRPIGVVAGRVVDPVAIPANKATA